MSQLSSNNLSQRMRYPSVFPNARSAWESVRNRINERVDSWLESEDPLKGAMQGISDFSKKILTRK